MTKPTSDVLARMTVQISNGVRKADSEEARAWPEDWDELAAQIGAMKARGEIVDAPYDVV